MEKKDLNDLMNESMVEICKDGFIEKTIKKRVEETITQSIKDVFCTYSDFGKAIEKAIQDEIKIDFSKLNLGAYSSTITTMIRNILSEKMSADAKTEVERFLKTIESNDIPNELKITEMVEKIVEFWQKDATDDQREGFEFSFHCFQRWPNDELLNDCYIIAIDQEGGKDHKDCNIQIDYNSKRESIDDVTISEKSMKDNTFYTTRKWQIEGYLFQLYANKVKLINDSQKVETYVEQEYND